MISTISEYDIEKAKVRHSPFKMMRLPDPYLNNVYTTNADA